MGCVAELRARRPLSIELDAVNVALFVQSSIYGMGDRCRKATTDCCIVQFHGSFQPGYLGGAKRKL